MLSAPTPAAVSPAAAVPGPIRTPRPAHWAWVDHALIDTYAARLGPIGVALYVALARYAHHATGQCWPSLGRLSQQLGITRLTARRYLQRLADHGLLALQERPGHPLLVTLLAVPQESQTGVPGKQVEEPSGLPGTQQDGHAVNRGCLPGQHEPECLNQKQRTSLGPVLPHQAPIGPEALGGPDVLPTPSTPRDPDLANAFAQLPASVQEELYAAATARLRDQGVQPAFCIRPVVLAEIFRSLESAPEPASPTMPPSGPEVAATVPAPPSLRDVTPADLRDLDRVLALGAHAVAQGWVPAGDATQLTIVAAAVHARRVGHDPGALFVALLRAQRWAVLTQADEDCARRWLQRAAPG